jgi:nucleoside-diphosphate-sugar epimerase
VLIALPGLVCGPGDTSQMGDQIRRAMAGNLPYVVFPTLGVNAVHVDDVVDGILLVTERGRLGQAFVLGGEITCARTIIDLAARVAAAEPRG